MRPKVWRVLCPIGGNRGRGGGRLLRDEGVPGRSRRTGTVLDLLGRGVCSLWLCRRVETHHGPQEKLLLFERKSACWNHICVGHVGDCRATSAKDLPARVCCSPAPITSLPGFWSLTRARRCPCKDKHGHPFPHTPSTRVTGTPHLPLPCKLPGPNTVTNRLNLTSYQAP